jgi:hypothetical protein
VNRFEGATLEELEFFERNLSKMQGIQLRGFYEWVLGRYTAVTPNAWVNHWKREFEK